MDDIGAASLEDVKDFFRTHYLPRNAVLTLVGDFEPGEARALVEQYFGGIPAGEAPPPVSATPGRLGGEKRKTIESPVQLPRVYRLYHVPKMGEDGWFAADLLGGVLAGGKASRLDRTLVYDQKIAQDVSAFVLPTEAAGMLIIAATAKERVSAGQLEAALDKEIETLFEEGVTDEEMIRVRNQTETDFAHQIEQLESRADLIGMFTTFFGDATLVDRWMDRYHAVRANDVAEMARKSMVAEERVTVQFVPAAKGGNAHE